MKRVLFFSAKHGKKVAFVDKASSPELFDISIGDREVATINNPLKINPTLPNPRVFHLLSTDIDDNEAILLLAIAILEMVDGVYSK